MKTNHLSYTLIGFYANYVRHNNRKAVLCLVWEIKKSHSELCLKSSLDKFDIHFIEFSSSLLRKPVKLSAQKLTSEVRLKTVLLQIDVNSSILSCSRFWGKTWKKINIDVLSVSILPNGENIYSIILDLSDWDQFIFIPLRGPPSVSYHSCWGPQQTTQPVYSQSNWATSSSHSAGLQHHTTCQHEKQRLWFSPCSIWSNTKWPQVFYIKVADIE